MTTVRMENNDNNHNNTIIAGLDGAAFGDILFPLSQHAKNTLLSIARSCPSAALKLSPFCHEIPDGAHDVRGWILDLPANAPASALPINCSMFDGLTLVQCNCTEEEVLDLLTHSAKSRERLSKAIENIMENIKEEQRATWRRCRPTANGVPSSLYSAFVGRDNKISLCSTQDCVPLVDSEAWVPELSPDGFIGLYHHWHPVKKRLMLYLVCQSYLPKACLEFADMVRDIGDACTAHDILHSEEVQWLRHACSRNRARLIAKVCESMGLGYPTMLDYCNAVPNERMAVSCTEGLHHDLLPHSKKRVHHRNGNGEGLRVLNYCSSTEHSANGSLCSMAPWEGIWVFHGSRQNLSEACFGLPYGSLHLPTIAPQVHEQHRNHSLTFTSSSGNLVRSGSCKGDHDSFIILPAIMEEEERLNLWATDVKDEDVLSQPKEESNRFNTYDDAVVAIGVGNDDTGLDPDLLNAYKRSIARLATSPLLPTRSSHFTKRKRYLLFDEHILQVMSKRGWDRALGYTSLIPLACGFYEHWFRHKEIKDSKEAGRQAHMVDLSV